MQQFFMQNSEILLRLAVATGLGMLIGAERIFVHKAAGMKTHALVSMGAAVFILISEEMVKRYSGLAGFNPAMMASQIIVGIGFLGAGVIIFREKESRLIGLTTASGLWVSAGIGMASGFGLFNLALITTAFILFILIVINLFEEPIKRISERHSKDSNLD